VNKIVDLAQERFRRAHRRAETAKEMYGDDRAFRKIRSAALNALMKATPIIRNLWK
jgi:hypothetical protein